MLVSNAIEAQKRLAEVEAELERNREHVETIAKEKKEVRQLMRQLMNEDGTMFSSNIYRCCCDMTFTVSAGWTLVGEHEDGNVTVYYRNEKSTPVHSIKMQGTECTDSNSVVVSHRKPMLTSSNRYRQCISTKFDGCHE